MFLPSRPLPLAWEDTPRHFDDDGHAVLYNTYNQYGDYTLIREGAVTLNYSICEKVDATVKEGDTLSVHGKGKGRISQIGGRSRKDRLFVEAELYL